MRCPLGHNTSSEEKKRKLISWYLKMSMTLRDTKTFATRRVVVSQRRPDGQPRPCMELIADFHVEEPALMMYSQLGQV